MQSIVPDRRAAALIRRSPAIRHDGIGMAMPQTVRCFEPGNYFHVFLSFLLLHQRKPVRHGLAIGFFNRREVRRRAVDFFCCRHKRGGCREPLNGKCDL